MKEQEFKAVMDWLANGQVGASSKAIVFAWAGVTNASWDYPLDPSDFGRCYNMLKRCPFININVMRDKSPTWTEFCDNWEMFDGLFYRDEHAQLYSEMKMITRRQDYNNRIKI